MKPYVPNRVIYAVQKIAKEHPLVGVAPGAITDSALKELVLLIDSKPMDELEAFSATVSRRESNSLCRYIGNNPYKVDLKKIAKVIYFCMNPDNYGALFRGWQQNPACTEALSLLGDFDDPKHRAPDFPVRQGLLKAWANAKYPLTAVAQTSTDIGKGSSFSERLSSIGLMPESTLGQQCYQQFFRIATIPQFAEEGDHKLWEVLCQSDKNLQEQILIHLLNFGEKAEGLLPSLKETYHKAVSLWKEPNSNYFPRENQKAFETYTWWYNYYQMASAFGRDADYRRVNFWKRFLHKCTCSRIRTHAMLVMDFGQYIVTEFEAMGPVYIFEVPYFKNFVTAKIYSKNTQEFKSWLYNSANHKDRQVHNQRWEYNQTRVLRKFHIV